MEINILLMKLLEKGLVFTTKIWNTFYKNKKYYNIFKINKIIYSEKDLLELIQSHGDDHINRIIEDDQIEKALDRLKIIIK